METIQSFEIYKQAIETAEINVTHEAELNKPSHRPVAVSPKTSPDLSSRRPWREQMQVYRLAGDEDTRRECLMLPALMLPRQNYHTQELSIRRHYQVQIIKWKNPKFPKGEQFHHGRCILNDECRADVSRVHGKPRGTTHSVTFPDTHFVEWKGKIGLKDLFTKIVEKGEDLSRGNEMSGYFGLCLYACYFLQNNSLQRPNTADENAVCPETANIIKRNCYVDDLITGTHTFDEAIRIEDKVLDIASNDAFALQQWIFNEKNFISDFVNHSTDTYIRVDLEETTFILGRTILSRIEKLFNPHDLLGPIINNAATLAK
ncbi:hypothetical protein HZH66_014705 [Vespula vulgaris]|uniref:Uncharacterized protein n=1 Tax=Vespula vulgaris TaxID=7454 RepID=A0A834J2G3_VESVU|nr:hypothetical protein HZH66_014705 [Vespula vulgaris]